ncbi:MAG: hypothetical protein WAX89_05410 [Alphaproteobacteria bacterium]
MSSAKMLHIAALRSYRFTILYTLLIPLVNMVLVFAPIYTLAPDVFFTPASFVAGLVYVLRDFAQNEIGRKNIFIAMAVAAFITYHLADPILAMASVAAFVFGEITDWLVYNLTHAPLSRRVLISSAIAVPVDIITVLIGFGYVRPGMMPLNIGNMLVMFMCAMAAAVLVSFFMRRHEKR